MCIFESYRGTTYDAYNIISLPRNPRAYAFCGKQINVYNIVMRVSYRSRRFIICASTRRSADIIMYYYIRAYTDGRDGVKKKNKDEGRTRRNAVARARLGI